jgi:hypothetical protein
LATSRRVSKAIPIELRDSLCGILMKSLDLMASLGWILNAVYLRKVIAAAVKKDMQRVVRVQ